MDKIFTYNVKNEGNKTGLNTREIYLNDIAIIGLFYTQTKPGSSKPVVNCFIQTKEGHLIYDFLHVYFKRLKSIFNDIGGTKLLRKERVEFMLDNGKTVSRYNKEYLCKVEKYGHYVQYTGVRTKRDHISPAKRKALNALVSARQQSGMYDHPMQANPQQNKNLQFVHDVQHVYYQRITNSFVLKFAYYLKGYTFELVNKGNQSFEYLGYRFVLYVRYHRARNIYHLNYLVYNPQELTDSFLGYIDKEGLDHQVGSFVEGQDAHNERMRQWLVKRRVFDGRLYD